MVFRKTNIIMCISLFFLCNPLIGALEDQVVVLDGIEVLHEPQISIEPYNKERDFAAVVKILDANKPYLRYESMGLAAGTTEQYINSPHYTTYVLRVEGETVGFINYMKIQKKVLFLNFGSVGCIHLMGVDTKYQGNYYGKMLLYHAINDLLDQGISVLFLATKPDNVKARKLYEKTGFQLMAQTDTDCIYIAHFKNDKAPAPTFEEKALNFALTNPGKALFGVAAALIAGSYLGYKGLKATWKAYSPH